MENALENVAIIINKSEKNCTPVPEYVGKQRAPLSLSGLLPFLINKKSLHFSKHDHHIAQRLISQNFVATAIASDKHVLSNTYCVMRLFKNTVAKCYSTKLKHLQKVMCKKHNANEDIVHI